MTHLLDFPLREWISKHPCFYIRPGNKCEQKCHSLPLP